MGAELYFGDCLTEMARLESGSVDMILCDLPYGTTACSWDAVIPFPELWAAYRRIAKSNAAIVLTASQPFTTALIASNYAGFAYELIWDKGRGFEPGLAKLRPQKAHESVVVFSGNGKMPAYNPLMVERDAPKKIRGNTSNAGQGILSGSGVFEKTYTHRYPTSVMLFGNAGQSIKVHPTQKPVALFEYLIKTYTNPGDVVLDNTMGSGTTGVACANTGRRFIGIERDPGYFAIAVDRIAKAQPDMRHAVRDLQSRIAQRMAA